MQSASDTKDGGSRIMSSFSSMDEDQVCVLHQSLLSCMASHELFMQQMQWQLLRSGNTVMHVSLPAI